MFIRAILLLVTLFFYSIHAPIQSTQDLPQAQRVVLDNPEVITLEFASTARRRSAYEKMGGPFEPASKIKFNLVGTNTSIVTLGVRRWDTYAQNKPRLFRDNQEVAYRNDITELLKEKHTKDSEIISLFVIKLAPNDPKILETFDLADWYEPLGPGHYELSTQHRFIQGGKWVDSAAIVFEVQHLNSK